ncbi:hypothetical protein BRARA_D00091 [Brassica rapa]|uniref:Uncharacterized protein n=1 Tax=Brassica campestris TaxID=3711 RepID=A0A397ZHB2_BRACM|nr:hypothetical protein BRARA_D00091 [Brassica rapa]
MDDQCSRESCHVEGGRKKTKYGRKCHRCCSLFTNRKTSGGWRVVSHSFCLICESIFGKCRYEKN